jgi:predicted AlkP superfamily pyrophosphatase or phosphodiesterase
MKKIFVAILFLVILGGTKSIFAQPPKLVVEIVLDQFPYDYIERFQPYFSGNGFNYFLHRGADFTNARYRYASTKTAPGHAAIATGCYNHLNGIVGNRWWDRANARMMNSVDDDDVRTLGTGGSGNSPKNLLTYTFGDMLRLSSNFRSKVISISHKDRSAVLMGGKFGKAFWIDDSVVVTSSYYMEQLPGWIARFNASGRMQQYFGKEWTELQPAVAMQMCDADDPRYEANTLNLGRSFPHRVTGDDPARMTVSYYRALDASPFAAELLFDLAREACMAESLGQRTTTDMLCIGISTTDEIGHLYGPQSREVFDNVLRTDAFLADFFSYLDKSIGLENCLIVLTSDHGIAPIPEYILSHSPQAPAGRISSGRVSSMVSSVLDTVFGKPEGKRRWVAGVVESDVYLDRSTLASKHLALETVTRLLKDSLAYKSPFAGAFTRNELEEQNFADGIGQLYARSFFSPRSGDIIFVLRPYYITSGDSVGTNHGQPYDYDSHVPLLLGGRNIVQGVFPEEVSPIDIAPTLSSLLHVEFPPSREGRVLSEVIRYTTDAPYFSR